MPQLQLTFVFLLHCGHSDHVMSSNEASRGGVENASSIPEPTTCYDTWVGNISIWEPLKEGNRMQVSHLLGQKG